MGILFLPILILIMYFMLIRPQQQRAKQQRQLLAELDVGDDVVTTAGIYGRVSDVDGNTLFLKITDDVEIKITKESVAALVTYDEDIEEDDIEDDVDDVVDDELVDDE